MQKQLRFMVWRMKYSLEEASEGSDKHLKVWVKVMDMWGKYMLKIQTLHAKHIGGGLDCHGKSWWQSYDVKEWCEGPAWENIDESIGNYSVFYGKLGNTLWTLFKTGETCEDLI